MFFPREIETYIIQLEDIIIGDADLCRIRESNPRLFVRNDLADVLDDKSTLRDKFLRFETIPSPAGGEFLKRRVLALGESAVLALVSVETFRGALVLELTILAIFVAHVPMLVTLTDFGL